MMKAFLNGETGVHVQPIAMVDESKEPDHVPTNQYVVDQPLRRRSVT